MAAIKPQVVSVYESGENYLETILILEKQNKIVRSVDVARKLGYSRASICRGMAILKEENCIFIDSKGFIYLTEKGRDIAEKVLEKHQVLTDFFEICAKVPRNIAEKDAFRTKYIISQETYAGIKNFIYELVNTNQKEDMCEDTLLHAGMEVNYE